jgi:hypothetical protein
MKQNTWLWAAAASPGLASMGREGGREGCGMIGADASAWRPISAPLASHLTAARLGPRTSGASDVLWFRGREDDDSTTGSREPGERAGAAEGRARGDLPCGRSPVRREDRGGVAAVDLSKTRGEIFCSSIWETVK